MSYNIKAMQGVSSHIETLKMSEDDEARSKTWCINFDNKEKLCKKRQSVFYGKSCRNVRYCQFYKVSKKGKRAFERDSIESKSKRNLDTEEKLKKIYSEKGKKINHINYEAVILNGDRIKVENLKNNEIKTYSIIIKNDFNKSPRISKICYKKQKGDIFEYNNQQYKIVAHGR
ncbi:MAG: hypothetical protein PEPC_00668 [Peptostreptococcus russellii]